MHRVTIITADHVDLLVIESTERTDKRLDGIVVGNELTRIRVLDLVAFLPCIIGNHTICNRALGCWDEVERCPVPPGLQLDRLPFVTVSCHHEQLTVTATVYETVRKEHIAIHTQVVYLTGRSLP